MAKTIEDELFVEIMHFSRTVRRYMMGERLMPHPGAMGQDEHPDQPRPRGFHGFDAPDEGPGFEGHPGHHRFDAPDEGPGFEGHPGHLRFDGPDEEPGFEGHPGHHRFDGPDEEPGFERHPGHHVFDGKDEGPGFKECRRDPGFAGPSGPPDFECPPPGQGPRGRRRPVLSRERILSVLAEHEEGLRQKQLSESMHVNASSISEFINRLEDDGYIVRNVDPSDKRATLISLTEKGRARAGELQDERNQKLQQLFRNLTEDEKQELLRLIRKVNI